MNFVFVLRITSCFIARSDYIPTFVHPRIYYSVCCAYNMWPLFSSITSIKLNYCSMQIIFGNLEWTKSWLSDFSYYCKWLVDAEAVLLICALCCAQALNMARLNAIKTACSIRVNQAEGLGIVQHIYWSRQWENISRDIPINFIILAFLAFREDETNEWT
jgi:hypothetical protein